MTDRFELRDNILQTARRKHQRIAAGQNDFPDFRMIADVVERGMVSAVGESAPCPGPTISRRKQNRQYTAQALTSLSKHAIRVAVHDPFNRAVRVVADRIAILLRRNRKFSRIRNELPRNRVVRIGGINQIGDIGRDRHGIAQGNLFHGPQPVAPARSARTKSSGVRRILRAVVSMSWHDDGLDFR